MQQPITKLAHIVNPVAVKKKSDLFAAQPVTFETMRTARAMAEASVKVDLFTAQFEEDRRIIPSFFTITEDLDRSVLDLGEFKRKRKLPLLKDVLGRLYESSDAEYFIYTNVDIALMPQFYLVVDLLIRNGFDAFVINRRTIPAMPNRTADIPLMYSTIGQSHGGYDCFVFRRDSYPLFELGNVCLGMAWVGRILLINLAAHAKRYQLIRDVHLTFHLGDDQTWRGNEYDDYKAFNEREGSMALKVLDQKYGPFNRATVPGIYLTDAWG